MREDIIAAANVLKEGDWTLKGVADELDIRVETLRRWWRDDQRASQAALVPVAVAVDSGAVVEGLSVVTPTGYRIEGLGVAEAARLIRALS